MKKKKDYNYLSGIFLSNHSEEINIIFGLAEGILGELYLSSIQSLSLTGLKQSNFFWLVILVVVISIHIHLTGYTKNILKENKEKIIVSLLGSCSDLLFENCNTDDWSICAMVQMRDGDVRRTPYFVDSEWNIAVDTPLDLRFGDVGNSFFNEQPLKFFSTRLSYEDYKQRPQEYQNQVPESLRAIFAQAIFSKVDDGKVIGVLEFDVLTRKGMSEFPEELYNSIIDYRNQNALGKWTKAIAYLLEGI